MAKRSKSASEIIVEEIPELVHLVGYLTDLSTKIPSESRRDFYRGLEIIAKEHSKPFLTKRSRRESTKETGIAYLILNLWGELSLEEMREYMPTAKEIAGIPDFVEISVEEGTKSLPEEKYPQDVAKYCKSAEEKNGPVYTLTSKYPGGDNVAAARTLANFWRTILPSEREYFFPNPFQKEEDDYECGSNDVIWNVGKQWFETRHLENFDE